VEVKTRSSETWRRPAAAVNRDKQRRIVATARDYLRLLERSNIPVRYDIVEVLLEEGRVNEIRHQPNAFAPARKSR
jgi:putative endonuclease